MRALAIAATGMNAQQTNVEVIANNIANINTTGFKRSRAEFTDLLYQAERSAGRAQPGRPGSRFRKAPASASASRTAAVRNLHMQGALSQTGNKLDLALNGRGWFQVAGAERREPLYARRRLQQERDRPDRDGRRLRRAAGHDHPDRMRPRWSSTRRGRSTRASAPTNTLQLIGQLTLANFTNDAGLDPLGGNLYRETTGFRRGRDRRARRSGLRQRRSRAIWRTPTSIR